MPEHSTSEIQQHPAIDTLEAICDVLDAIGGNYLPAPLRQVRLEIHSALALTDVATTDNLCRHLSRLIADIAAEAQRQESEALFSSRGVALTLSQGLAR